MGIREIEIFAGEKLVIHELRELCDSSTGRVLTGSWIWDSALVFSRWISTHGQLRFDFRGQTVLELGAGTGLPGLTAARIGAGRVILTDVEPLLPALEANVEVNGLRDRVQVNRLVWGSDDLPGGLRDEEVVQVDLVLMSDVFYDSSEMAALVKTLKNICSDSTRVWAATEVRPWTGECLSELLNEGFGVVELMSQLGSSYEPDANGEGGDTSNAFAVLEIIPPNQMNEGLKN